MLLFLALGGVLLVGGADLLVRGAARLALRFGLSPLVIGLTVVAFGTSAPELAVSVQSGLAGQPDIAVGNIVGSNIFNMLVVLGVSALITPLLVQQQLIRLDVPLLFGVSLLFWLLAIDGRIGLFDGGLLTSGAVAYAWFAVRQGRREAPAIQDEYGKEFGGGTGHDWLARLPVQVGMIAAGLLLLVVGASWLVESAVLIARSLGISEVVIGVTVVAAGTSLPELATSAVAAARGERDIAVGNVVGSSLFNILGIGGLAALVTPGGLAVHDALIAVDLPVMVAVALAGAPIMATDHTIARWEGGVFLASYAAFITYLILDATAHPALPGFIHAMTLAIPLVGALLLVTWIRHRQSTGR